MVEQEKANFQKFKEFQKANECFNSLPWKNAANMGADARYYPYSDYAQKKVNGKADYARRTNLRFTDMYGHLLAKSKEYEKVKYFLAMEEAGCSRMTTRKSSRSSSRDLKSGHKVCEWR